MALLRPRVQGHLNQWHRGSLGERLTTALFVSLGVGFWVFVFVLFSWLVSTFHQVEVFGPILSRKLLELERPPPPRLEKLIGSTGRRPERPSAERPSADWANESSVPAFAALPTANLGAPSSRLGVFLGLASAFLKM